MLKAYCWVVSRLKSEKGATAVEYGMLVALIAAVIILVVVAVGDKVWTAFDTVQKNWVVGAPKVPTP